LDDNVFLAAAEEAITLLDDARRVSYLSARLPCPLDDAIARICDLFMEALPEQREIFSSTLDADHCSVLLLFSERMAVLGLRGRSYSRLLRGLVALAIVDSTIDLKDILPVFSLHYHSALKLDVDPMHLFQEAAEYANSQISEQMAGFPTRKPEDKALSSMGYKEVDTPNGLMYLRTW
jgi:hypothetical protein